MITDTSRRTGGAWFVVAILCFLAALAYVVVAALTTSDLADSRDDAPLLLLGAAGSLSLVGWWRDRRGRSAREEEEGRERERLATEAREREARLGDSQDKLDSVRRREARQRQTREDLESRLEEREKALNRERYLRRRSEEARQAEGEWSRQLQAEVMRMHRELGALGDTSDVPTMVLRLSKKLLGAGKGLLLTREGEDGDGKLVLASAEGFDHDPGQSEIARRFADEVIAQDQIVREDEPEGEVERTDSPADREIENLVAVPIYVQDRFSGVIVCANKEGGFGEYDEEVLLSLGNHAGAVLRNGRLQGELRASYLATVRVLGEALEAKDPFLRGHSEEVSGYVAAVAERLGLEPSRREQLLFASLLHDVGKIGISERILLKPAELTPEERNVVELHPRIGHHIVRQVPALDSMADSILHHHERFDGTGYPSGLRGEEIPLEARIICVTDAFSAMTAERPYQGRMSLEEACAELERAAGTQFDPEIVRVFVDEVRKSPPNGEGLRSLEAVLEDPELQRRREGDEPVLGYGPLALTDNLTLLYTRRYLHENAEAEARRSETRGRPFGVVLVEPTEIARLNRRQGYWAGDEAIRTAARTLQRFGARVGGTTCRYGGPRLGLLVPDTDEPAAEALAAEIVESLLQDGLPARAGFAAWRPGDDGESVIARASARLT